VVARLWSTKNGTRSVCHLLLPPQRRGASKESSLWTPQGLLPVADHGLGFERQRHRALQLGWDKGGMLCLLSGGWTVRGGVGSPLCTWGGRTRLHPADF
jgi:hypothetical protein